jgi:hypothetical protein
MQLLVLPAVEPSFAGCVEPAIPVVSPRQDTNIVGTSVVVSKQQACPLLASAISKGQPPVPHHEIHAFVLGAMAPQTRLVTDERPSYQGIAGVRHKVIMIGPMAARVVLPGPTACSPT